MSRNEVGQECESQVIVTSRKGRVSRNMCAAAGATLSGSRPARGV